MNSSCADSSQPSFTHHFIERNAPDIFIAFWITAAVVFLFTSVIVGPSIYRVLRAAFRIRNLQNDILIPSSYRATVIILAHPPVAVLCNLFILLAPTTANALNFLIATHGSFTLMLFAFLVVQYLGIDKMQQKVPGKSVNDSSRSWQELAPPSKFYAAPPCCCLWCCVPKRNLTTKDIRRFSWCILQFALFGPLGTFLQLFPNMPTNAVIVFIAIQGVSVNICIFGTNAIFMASKDVLRKTSLACAWNLIQLGFNLWWMPAFILNFCKIPAFDQVYTTAVMISAYGAILQCVVWVLLSIAYRHYVDVSTAHEAYTSMASERYIKLEDAETPTASL